MASHQIPLSYFPGVPIFRPPIPTNNGLRPHLGRYPVLQHGGAQYGLSFAYYGDVIESDDPRHRGSVQNVAFDLPFFPIPFMTVGNPRRSVTELQGRGSLGRRWSLGRNGPLVKVRGVQTNGLMDNGKSISEVLRVQAQRPFDRRIIPTNGHNRRPGLGWNCRTMETPGFADIPAGGCPSEPTHSSTPSRSGVGPLGILDGLILGCVNMSMGTRVTRLTCCL